MIGSTTSPTSPGTTNNVSAISVYDSANAPRISGALIEGTPDASSSRMATA